MADRVPRGKRCCCSLLALFTLGNAMLPLAPYYGSLVAARYYLPAWRHGHGTVFFAYRLDIATDLVEPEKESSGYCAGVPLV